MGRQLASGDCKGACAWSGTDDRLEELVVFACAGCGSEWTAAQAWTPRNADGEVNPAVAAERAAHPVQNRSPW